MSTTTIYEKKSGKAVFCYLASVDEFLATGNYTTQEPGKPAAPPELAKAKLPGAGREMSRGDQKTYKPGIDRAAAPEEPKAATAETETGEKKPDAPQRKPPRRRSE